MAVRLVLGVFAFVCLAGCQKGTERDYATAEELNAREEVSVDPSDTADVVADTTEEALSTTAQASTAEPSEPENPTADTEASAIADQQVAGAETPTTATKLMASNDTEPAPRRDPSVTPVAAVGSSEPTTPPTVEVGDDGFPIAYHEMPAWVAEGPESAVRVSFDDLDLLKLMNAEPVPNDVAETLPKRISTLDGQRVRIRGFMMPPFATTGLAGFTMARDNELCCFGREPKVYDLIPVKLREGQTTRYIQMRPFDVVGVLHLIPDIEMFELYYIDDAVVIE